MVFMVPSCGYSAAQHHMESAVYLSANQGWSGQEVVGGIPNSERVCDFVYELIVVTVVH